MNDISHADIMIGACRSLPEKFRAMLNLPEALIGRAGNYPDLFDAPTTPDEKKYAIDPNWKKFIILPETMPAPMLHFIPAPVADTFVRIPVYDYYFRRMITELQAKNYEDFIKFAGCLSHAMGDTTQPAHIGPDSNNLMISHLLPVPDKPELKAFHYHTSVEAVVGKCAGLRSPRLLGLSPAEAAWKLAAEARKAVYYCRRFLVPMILAIFDGDQKRAEELAVEPVTIAAQLSADAIYTACCLAEGAEANLPAEDLRELLPVEEFHDLVYGGAVLDGNKKVPPNDVPVTPGTLKVNGIVTPMPGLGMLPHSGMYGDRCCFMTWQLPGRIFKTFTAMVGLHAGIGTGAVDFHVELDGKTVWTSGRMDAAADAKECMVELGDAGKLTLRVWDADNGGSFWNNHAYWGHPELNR